MKAEIIVLTLILIAFYMALIEFKRLSLSKIWAKARNDLENAESEFERSNLAYSVQTSFEDLTSESQMLETNYEILLLKRRERVAFINFLSADKKKVLLHKSELREAKKIFEDSDDIEDIEILYKINELLKYKVAISSDLTSKKIYLN